MRIATRAAISTVAAIAVRPGLWATAVAELAVMAQPGWWRRWPPLPRPAPAYLRFRLHTAYGRDVEHMDAGQVIDYLGWCRRMRGLR